MWWIGREMLHPDSGFDVCLPPDDADRLMSELCTPKWKRRPDGKIWVETKKDVRSRLDNNSTDYADGVLMALVGPTLCDERDQADMVQVGYDPIDRHRS